MKLLIYNWVQFDNRESLGGGVSIYLKRLIPELVKQGVEVSFLSVMSDDTRDIKIVPTENCFRQLGVTSYALLNSPIPFPHKEAFGAENLINNEVVTEVLRKFISRQEPNAVHFHSIEGIPASALRLKERFAEITFLFTAHNYHLVCQQIQLFQKARMRNCQDFLSGHACQTCQLPDFDNLSAKEMLVNRVPWSKTVFDMLDRLIRMVRPRSSGKQLSTISRARVNATWLNNKPKQSAEYFSHWRSYNTESAMRYLDSVLVVSQLQRDLLLQAGFDTQKIQVLNPAVSNHAVEITPVEKGAVTTISYWGYSNPGTGLSLFLDSLALLADRYADSRSISILIVSDIGRRFRDRLALLEPFFSKIEIVKRYDQEMMKTLAKDIDLAVTGPLLQETYCQVAAELYFLGVPVLASSTLGFAGEHIRDERFVFKSGSETDLVKRLLSLVEQPELLLEYWKSTSAPPLLTLHSQKLISIYRQPISVVEA